MIILIAESKTMAPCHEAIPHRLYTAHRPAFDDEAGSIMASLCHTKPDVLAKQVKISLAMARRLQQMILEFPDKVHGATAIEAYTGVVFKALDYRSMDAAARMATARRVRIISSLYGWLAPDDFVKPYRFDFTTRLAPGDTPFASWWRTAVTQRLIDTLQQQQCTEVLDLLPADAARAIDWGLVSQHATVCKADFIEIRPGGLTATPNSNRLKTLRGELLRQIICNDIPDLATLATTAGDSYFADPNLHTPGHIVFTTA